MVKDNSVFKSKILNVLVFQFALVLVGLLASQAVFSQIDTRSLNGVISLDVSEVDTDLQLNVAIRNHSFVVLSVFPFIAIRPVISQRSETIKIDKGAASASYRIDGIENDPVDYSIQISCLACGSYVPTQFYTSTGNRFSLSGGAYIDPDDLGSTLDLNIITRGRIEGEIVLKGDKVSNRDIKLTLSVVSSVDNSIILKTIEGLTLATGKSRLAYSVSGLDRSLARGYQIKVDCENCFGKSARSIFSEIVLNSSVDHKAVDIVITDQPFVLSPLIMEILL